MSLLDVPPEYLEEEQRRITRFAKRLNVVLRHAGWPECEYMDGPRLWPDCSEVWVTVHALDLEQTEHYTLHVKRRDTGDSLVVQATMGRDEVITSPIAAVRLMNQLVRGTRRALA